jgi:hypothetical protein
MKNYLLPQENYQQTHVFMYMIHTTKKHYTPVLMKFTPCK